MEHAEQVLEAMRKAGKPLKAGEVAELAGLDKKVVEKVMDQLKKTEMIVSPKRCYWQPK
jgi:DNA-binding IscR family transcriptional regulator